MKAITTLTLATLMSLSTMASTLSIFDVRNGASTLNTSQIHLSKADFTRNFPKDMSYEKCKDSIIRNTIMTFTGVEYDIIMTDNNDNCDGGNSVGYVTQIGDYKIVATMHDGEFILIK